MNKYNQLKHGNPDPSVVKEIEVTTKEQRLGIEDSTNNIPTSAQHPDPCKYCEVYIEMGCSHVDGYLCEPRTCNILYNHRMKI